MIASLTEAVAAVVGHPLPKRLGVAVSGGGDSVALLAVLKTFAREKDVELRVVTVDHGIRPEAQQEISFVAELCAKWGLSHEVVRWTGWTGQGNFQAVARNARYTLMSDWARTHEIDCIALGHTADDQAETFVMRLARGAGVDGLSAMAPRRADKDITWLRPLLQFRRATLRTFLKTLGLTWCEDPSNENRDFERINVRDALVVLENVGVSVETLVQVAGNMAKARAALSAQAFEVAIEISTFQDGALGFDQAGYLSKPEEVQRRLMVQAIQWITGKPYGSRGATVDRLLTAVGENTTTTLDGCQCTIKGGLIWVFREYNAVRNTVSSAGTMWDGRWSVTGPHMARDLQVRPLGFDPLTSIERWRDAGLPRAALASTPSIWYGDELIAAPVAQQSDEWAVCLERGKDTYFSALLSH